MSAPGYAAVAFRVAARALRKAKGLKNNEGAPRQQDVFSENSVPGQMRLPHLSIGDVEFLSVNFPGVRYSQVVKTLRS